MGALIVYFCRMSGTGRAAEFVLTDEERDRLVQWPARSCPGNRIAQVGVGLQLVQLRIDALDRHQLVMRARLDEGHIIETGTTMRSARRTVENRCEMYTVVRPSARCRSRAMRSDSARASSAELGSSRMSSVASRMNDRPSATRCHSPPDRLAP